MNSNTKTLEEAVADNPFSDYQDWWSMGLHFVTFMSQSIVGQWRDIGGGDANVDTVRAYAARYVQVVYGREARAGLVDAFLQQHTAQPLQSGEFDALSYAFFRSAFEQIASVGGDTKTERRLFTKRVGRRFFDQLQAHLSLQLPRDLQDEGQLAHLKRNIAAVGQFLAEQGYLRDHFAFIFDVQVQYRGRRLAQEEDQFLPRLHEEGMAHALYKMGYPVILPSAVYLYQTIGEAQHHSSRTIEELFDRIGYEARETDDFDPAEHPSQRVVELWEIRKKRQGAG